MLKSNVKFRWIVLATIGIFIALGTSFAQSEITVVQGAGPRDLDPHVDETVPVMDVYRHIFEALVYLDGEGNIQPWLAESWEQIDDTTTRFFLREGVTFHNGDNFTANTVKYNIERIWDPEVASTKTVRLAALKEARVIDDYTVDLITSERFPLLMTYLPILLMVSENHAETNTLEYVRQNPVGTGVFQFDSWRPDQYVTLIKNENYWGEPANVDSLTFRFIPEAATRIASLMSGQADLVSNIPPLLAGQVDRSPSHTLVEGNMGMAMVLHINTLAESPLQDVRVRRALNHAVDMEAIITGVLSGYGRALQGQMADETTFGFNPELSEFEYDPEKARDLLAEAGYPDGFTLNFYSPQGRYPNDRETAEAIAGMWQDIGVSAEIITREWGTFLEELKGKEKADGVWLIGWYWTPTFDASTTAAWFSRDGVYNIWDTPAEYDELLSKAAQSTDPEEREAALSQAFAIMNEEAAAVFLHQPIQLYGISNRLSGWEPRPDDAVFLHNAEKE